VLRIILNGDHLQEALSPALQSCRHRLFLSTANVKDLHIPAGRSRDGTKTARSILEVLDELGKRGVETRLLHGGVPSGPLLARMKHGMPRGLTMRLCPRVHAKAVIVDGKGMYLGSANLTGAGLGAKSARRRNFEAGIWTDQVELIDPVADMLEEIWNGGHCRGCGRGDYCPTPLEEPEL
jgi:phosphatidylserine/phosphatidylglycerophosphate/cardiolipin synthase-like enzyme